MSQTSVKIDPAFCFGPTIEKTNSGVWYDYVADIGLICRNQDSLARGTESKSRLIVWVYQKHGFGRLRIKERQTDYIITG